MKLWFKILHIENFFNCFLSLFILFSLCILLQKTKNFIFVFFHIQKLFLPSQHTYTHVGRMWPYLFRIFIQTRILTYIHTQNKINKTKFSKGKQVSISKFSRQYKFSPLSYYTSSVQVVYFYYCLYDINFFHQLFTRQFFCVGFCDKFHYI